MFGATDSGDLGGAGVVHVPVPRLGQLRPLLQLRHVGLDGVGDPVEHLVLVDRPVRAALTRGAVVRDQDDDRVVQLPALLEVVQQPADLVVGVAEESRVDLGHPREQPFLIIGERIPGPHGVEFGPALPVGARLAGVRVDRRQFGFIGDDAGLLLPLEDQLPVRFVAHVELAAVFVDPFFRGVMRCVARPRAVVEEERLVGGYSFRVADELQRPVGQVGGEVITL